MYQIYPESVPRTTQSTSNPRVSPAQFPVRLRTPSVPPPRLQDSPRHQDYNFRVPAFVPASSAPFKAQAHEKRSSRESLTPLFPKQARAERH